MENPITQRKMKVFYMSTAYEHIKQYSQSPFTLECEVCQQVYPVLSVRSHLKTKSLRKMLLNSQNK